MKKYIAYILMFLGLALPISGEIIVSNNLEKLEISQDMYESPKGIKAIISSIEAQITGTRLKAVSLSAFVFLFGIGVSILLYEKYCELKNRIEKLERQLDNKP